MIQRVEYLKTYDHDLIFLGKELHCIFMPQEHRASVHFKSFPDKLHIWSIVVTAHLKGSCNDYHPEISVGKIKKDSMVSK